MARPVSRKLAHGLRMLLIAGSFGAPDHQPCELKHVLLPGAWVHLSKKVLFVTHDLDEAVFLGSRWLMTAAQAASAAQA